MSILDRGEEPDQQECVCFFFWFFYFFFFSFSNLSPPSKQQKVIALQLNIARFLPPLSSPLSPYFPSYPSPPTAMPLIFGIQ